MTNKFLTTVFVLMTSVSFAQQNKYGESSVESNEIYNDVESASDIRDPNLVRGSNEAIDTANSPQINIYNANSNANKQAQKANAQTDSAVDSTLNSDVRADVGNDYIARANEIRRARKDMEVGTEQKMIEKIEWSRIEDEKDRNDRLFGNRLDKKHDNYASDYQNQYQQSQKEVVVVEKPVYQTAPAPSPVVYKEEIKEVYEEKSLLSDSKSYLSPSVGWLTYPSAVNVDSATNFGIAMGTQFSSGVSIEGGLTYGTFKMEDYDVSTYFGQPGQKEVNQYGINTAVKYNFTMGRISPNLGAILGYTYRDYTEKRAFDAGTTSSSAVDAGISAGVDFKLTSALSLGVEYRMMKNVWNDREDRTNNLASTMYRPYSVNQHREKLEAIGSQQFGVNAKFSF